MARKLARNDGRVADSTEDSGGDTHLDRRSYLKLGGAAAVSLLATGAGTSGAVAGDSTEQYTTDFSSYSA